MTKAIAKTDLNELLANAEGDYVGAWKALVKSVGEELAAKQPRSTIEERKGRWAKALETMERRGPISEINKKMQGFVRAVRAQTIGTNPEPREMVQEEADELMSAFLDARDIAEFVATFKDEVVRPAVFAHLDAQGVGSGRVTTTLGTDFCRDVLADADPSLDREALKADLTPEQIASVFKTKVVTTEDVDYEALLREVDLETVRKHLVPGAARTPRFTTRASKPSEKE